MRVRMWRGLPFLKCNGFLLRGDSTAVETWAGRPCHGGGILRATAALGDSGRGRRWGGVRGIGFRAGARRSFGG